MRYVAVVGVWLALLAAGLAARDADSAVGGQGQARVTIFARPTTVDSGPITLFGSVASGRAEEEIVIQAKDCGSGFFRVFAGAVTRDGGGWSTVVYPRVGTAFRAVWNDATSAPVAIRVRAALFLDKLRGGRGFRVGAGGLRSLWRKSVVIQRRQGGRWSPVKRVILTDSLDSSGSGSWTEARFTLSVPKGTIIRAALPLSQARPCYLAGFSRSVRT